MKKTRIGQRIYLVEFPSQYQLAATFLRFQEHYESREFSGRVFSLEDFMDWYAERHDGFTYFEDWDGFNIPGRALDEFYAGRFDPLLRKEQRFLDLFRREKGEFYVIGLVEGGERSDPDGFRHEFAHALFGTSPEYREAVLEKLSRHDTSGIKSKLREMGYCDEVLEDETQAWLLSGIEDLNPQNAKRLGPLRRALEQLYVEHCDASRKDAC